MRIHVATAALTALALAGCDSGGSAVETRDRSAAEPVTLISAAAPDAEAEAAPEARPSVTANRRETADAKIQRLYERNGAAFGAKSADDYLRKVLAFTEATPKGTETVKRPNGDTGLDQHLRRGGPRRGAAHHVQARRRPRLLGAAEGAGPDLRSAPLRRARRGIGSAPGRRKRTW